MKTIKSGMIIGVPLIIIAYLIYKIMNSITGLGSVITGNTFSGMALGLVIVITFFYILGLISHILSVDRPVIKLITKVWPSLRVLTSIKKNGGFPEVRFQSYGFGMYKKGIITAEREDPKTEMVYCTVMEIRPFTLGMPIHEIEKDRLDFTGRQGWKLIQESWFPFLPQDNN